MFLYDIPPCKDCKKRCMACHSMCSEYKVWKSDHDSKRAKIIDEQKTSMEIVQDKIRFIDNYRKKTKKKK